jgi:hypothetical protein
LTGISYLTWFGKAFTPEFDVGGKLPFDGFIQEYLYVFDVFTFRIPIYTSLLQKLEKTTSPAKIYFFKIALLIAESAMLLE